MNQERLYDAYNRYFQVIPANTPELLEKVFRLRYQVYCIEHSFEDAATFPDGLERDRFDAHSVHSLLTHRPSGSVAGTVRLILPGTEEPAVDLPIEQVCREPVLQGAEQIPRKYTAEVSRFAVTKTFRRRVGEAGSPSGVTEESLREQKSAGASGSDRRMAHHITLGLIASLVQMSAENGILVWCSVMDRALLRLLTRIGIHFTNIGPEIEYHGKRQPCFAFLTVLLERVKKERPDVWEILTDDGRFGFPASYAGIPIACTGMHGATPNHDNFPLVSSSPVICAKK